MKRAVYIAALLISLTLISAECPGRRLNVEQAWDKATMILGQISEPEFKDEVYDIRDFGATPGPLLSTTFIQKAIDACSDDGGGVVLISEGKYMTGAIHLKSNVNLHISENAELGFSTDPNNYLPLVRTRWEGRDCMNYSPLIYANNQENIAVTGKGTLNGNADNSNWWPWKGRTEYGWKEGMDSQDNAEGRPRLQQYEIAEIPIEERMMGKGSFLRPQFINFVSCRNILVENLTIKNAPFWIIHPLLSENIILRGLTIDSHGPNNDGCDPESSRNVLIEDCYFDTGDDCIAIKSGRNKDGRRSNAPSENIIVRNCTMHNGHGGVVLGSEISGGARNIFVEDCRMNSPELERAIRIKTNSNRGGAVEHIYVRDIEIGEVKEAILKINCEYDIKSEGRGHFFPEIRNVVLERITSEKSKYPVYIKGIEGRNCIDSILLRNCIFEGVERTSYIEFAGEVNFENTDIKMAD